MKKRYKILISVLILLGVTIIFPPKKNENGLNIEPFIVETNPPQGVQVILKNACYDCHSNQTIYPWYNNLPVLNYWLAHHVDEGKEHLNFSEWQHYNIRQKEHVLEECVEEIKKGKMPLKTYIIKHPEAKLTKEQIDLLVKWVNKISSKFE